MAKGRTYRIGAFIDNGDGNHYALLEAVTGNLEHGIKIPADWLARGMTTGDTIRATEEMPGVIRFRELTDHKDQQALDELNSSDPGGDITIDDTNP